MNEPSQPVDPTDPVTLPSGDIQRYAIFRAPDWRWQRVLELVDRFPAVGRCSRRDDRWISVARAFVQRWRHCSSKEERDLLFPTHPGLWNAYQIYERSGHGDRSYAQILEARILARQTDAEIAHELDTIPNTILWYKALFFDVRKRLDARDWIIQAVLAPAILRQSPTARIAQALPSDSDDLPANEAECASLPYLDASMKHFAYFGGPHALDMVLHTFRSGKRMASPDDWHDWANGVTLDQLRRRAAQVVMTARIDKFNTIELLRGFLRGLEIEKDDGSPDQQRSKLERHLSTFLEDVPYTVGDSKAALQRPHGKYLETHEELRDSELDALAAGKEVADVTTFTDPPPPKQRNLQPEDLGELYRRTTSWHRGHEQVPSRTPMRDCYDSGVLHMKAIFARFYQERRLFVGPFHLTYQLGVVFGALNRTQGAS
jgi:hypothetical protein